MTEKIRPWEIFYIGPFYKTYMCPDCGNVWRDGETSALGMPKRCPYCGKKRIADDPAN